MRKVPFFSFAIAMDRKYAVSAPSEVEGDAGERSGGDGNESHGSDQRQALTCDSLEEKIE